MKVCITGQNGFVGWHLKHVLQHETDVECPPFANEDFDNRDRLVERLLPADAVVHLAAMNRHPDPSTIYDTNLYLVDRLIDALAALETKPHVVFASSTQEDFDNSYGLSKKEGRLRLAEWCRCNENPFTGLIIPNVFGPFGQPDYNSVVATFCHRIVCGETPEVKVDRELPLVHVTSLSRQIAKVLQERIFGDAHAVTPDTAWTVTQILAMLQRFAREYVDAGSIPVPDLPAERDLFNMFVTYLDIGSFYPRQLEPHADDRGSFVEVARIAGRGGQVSFSTTRPGVTRGNHYHTRKFERFAVVSGRARIRLRRVGTDEEYSFDVDGSRPAVVDMPVWYTHNITNIGDDDLLTVFWIDEPFAPEDPDTFFEEV